VHNYQRSLPLQFNQEQSSKPLVTSVSKTEYKNPNGVIFTIVGTGGGKLPWSVRFSSIYGILTGFKIWHSGFAFF
jgi:hypothetical protein